MLGASTAAFWLAALASALPQRELRSLYTRSEDLPERAATKVPQVSLLQDTLAFDRKQSLRLLANEIALRKPGGFHFGSTVGLNTTAWTSARFRDTWNHGAPENSCKWYSTQADGPDTFTLEACRGVQEYLLWRGDSFRGHNTFWHNQLPPWLPGNYTRDQLQNQIIPHSVKGVMRGIGPLVVSWDTVNEAIGDNVTAGMTAAECVAAKGVWPTVVRDGSTQPLYGVSDAFVVAAFKAAGSAGVTHNLWYNEYNIGDGRAKTQCLYTLMKDIKRQGAPVSGVGLQSHISGSPGGFPTKGEMHTTFNNLRQLGLTAAITELDCWLQDNSTDSFRYQAAIFGDYVDVCLYSPNCQTVVFWDNRDDESWLQQYGHPGSAPTLFDYHGNPKLGYYEVMARFVNYLRGGKEPCATSDGVGACKVGGHG